MGGKLTKLLVALAGAAAFTLPGAATPAHAAATQATVGDCIAGLNWGTLRPELASAALALVNQHRTAMGLVALKVSPTLTAAANWKSLHMGGTNYFDHYDLNYPTPGVNRDPFDRMKTCGYTYNAAMGENIAYGYSSADAVVN